MIVNRIARFEDAAEELARIPKRDLDERVIRVDRQDRPKGFAGKLDAHREGWLHRAFSILVFNGEGELFLQRRAGCKYHFAGLWSNTCCGHPRPGESTSQAAARRLNEELGFSVPLKEFHRLVYRADDPVTGLVEYEYLHVFRGVFNGQPSPDPLEVGAWVWESVPSLRQDLRRNPEAFTPWFTLLFGRMFPDDASAAAS